MTAADTATPPKSNRGGARPGARDNASELQVDVLPPQTRESALEGKPDDQLTEITQMALQMFGELAELPTHERVEILIIRHGWKQAEVARALGITPQAVNQHWAKICEELDVDELPQRQRAILARQCDTMFQRAARMGDEGKGIVLALKAIELKAKLLGLNMEALPPAQDTLPYSTPQEIMGDVRQKVLELHSKRHLIAQK